VADKYKIFTVTVRIAMFVTPDVVIISQRTAFWVALIPLTQLHYIEQYEIQRESKYYGSDTGHIYIVEKN
jgi:hypothetical protein